MSKFKELNTYVNTIAQMICNNQNLCKLLYFNTKDALGEDDLEDPAELLINKNILFHNSVPSENDKAKSVLSIVLNDFENDGSIYLRKNVITFNILIHNDLWLLENGEFRVFKIMEELDTLFNKVHNQNDLSIVSKLTFRNANHLWANYKYSGYCMNYGIWNFN